SLAAQGAREAIPDIAALLSGSSRQAAAEALGKLRSDAHAGDIARLIYDPDFQIRYPSAMALLALDPVKAAAAVSDALDRDNRVLVYLPNPELFERLRPVDALVRRTRDANPDVREKAVEWLGRLAGAEARKAVGA